MPHVSASAGYNDYPRCSARIERYADGSAATIVQLWRLWLKFYRSPSRRR